MIEGAEIPAFGEALAIFCTRAELSQQKLAKALGKSRRAIAAWEGGEYLREAKGKTQLAVEYAYRYEYQYILGASRKQGGVKHFLC